MITNTTIKCENKTIIIARLIKHNYTIIDFNHDVSALSLCPYFTMTDDEFLKLGRRVKVKLSE